MFIDIYQNISGKDIEVQFYETSICKEKTVFYVQIHSMLFKEFSGLIECLIKKLWKLFLAKLYQIEKQIKYLKF